MCRSLTGRPWRRAAVYGATGSRKQTLIQLELQKTRVEVLLRQKPSNLLREASDSELHQ